MKRYRLTMRMRPEAPLVPESFTAHEMPDGEWCDADDAIARIRELEAENARLREQVETDPYDDEEGA